MKTMRIKAHTDNCSRALVFAGKVCALLCIVLLCGQPLGAQSPVEPTLAKAYQFGLYAGLSFHTHSTAFSALPGVPGCCPEFSSGTGITPQAGLLHRVAVLPSLALELRTGYEGRAALLESIEPSTVSNSEGQDVPAEILHTLDTRMHYLGVSLSFTVNVFPGLWLSAGTGVSFPLGRNFTQTETLLSPENGTFENGTRLRNAREGDLPESSALQNAVHVGVGYELPLASNSTWKLVPELRYSYWLSSPVASREWDVQSLNFGLSVRGAPFRSAENPAPHTSRRPRHDSAPPVPPTASGTQTPALSLEGSIRAVGLDSAGVELEHSVFRVEEFRTSYYQPLLPYVFFEEESSVLRPEYIQSETRSRHLPLDSIVKPGDAVHTYYNILDIVGRRMREHPEAALDITGHNAGTGPERGNRSLSLARAEALARYLDSVWSVATQRMRVRARNLPALASRAEDAESEEENRRVELHSEESAILAPVVSTRLSRKVHPPALRIYPSVKNMESLAAWWVEVRQDTTLLVRWNGFERPDSILDWHFPPDIALKSGTLQYSLSLQDTAGNILRTREASLPVKMLRHHTAGHEASPDIAVERFVVLFPIRSAVLDEANTALLTFIARRIQQRSTVVVRGYADKLGDESYNARLSRRRAEAVAQYLAVPQVSIQGVGENTTLYDSSLPEGRCYTRTVEIIIETPQDKR